MGAVSKILGPDGKPLASVNGNGKPSHHRVVRARYDAVTTNQENTRHWSQADGLSARAANSPEVREKLRNRSRYECHNNCYANGIIQTLANDTIGTGPRLQLLTDDPRLNGDIERAFTEWSNLVGLGEKLRVMRQARAVDGEAFAIMDTNPRIEGDVQLDLRLVEAEQVATPDLAYLEPNAVDGVRYDKFGNPVEYHVLKEHPGDGYYGAWGEYDSVPARFVLHWFRRSRPGQCRGIPDLTPALPLFAQLRRYTLAVIASAETAADFAAVLTSDAPPDSEVVEGNPFETLEIERRMMTLLPAGMDMKQFDAKQPSTAYSEFKHEILNEIARCLNMPYNIAAGNSSGYNYSSGRLDHQVYFKSLLVDQAHVELTILDRVLAEWLDEFSLVSSILPAGPKRLGGWPHQWFWDGQEHVDPGKEARAQKTRLETHVTTLAYEYGRRGMDWEVQLRQRAKEINLMKELGLDAPAKADDTEPDPERAEEVSDDFADR